MGYSTDWQPSQVVETFCARFEDPCLQKKIQPQLINQTAVREDMIFTAASSDSRLINSRKRVRNHKSIKSGKKEVP